MSIDEFFLILLGKLGDIRKLVGFRNILKFFFSSFERASHRVEARRFFSDMLFLLFLPLQSPEKRVKRIVHRKDDEHNE